MMSDKIAFAALRTMRAALQDLLDKHPFFGTLALHVPFKLDRQRMGVACDGNEIRFDPDWVLTQTPESLSVVTARIVLACALKHHTRRDDRDYMRWQKSSLVATAPILIDADLLRYEGGIDQFLTDLEMPYLVGRIEGMDCETIYTMVQDEDDECQPKPQPQPQGGSQENDEDGSEGGEGDQGTSSHDDNGQGQPQPQDDDQEDEQDDDQQGNEQDETDEDSQEQEQDDSNGDDTAEEPPPQENDPRLSGEVMDAPPDPQPQEGDDAGQSSSQPHQQQDARWDDALRQSEQFAKVQGNMPGAMEATILAGSQGTVDWRELLQRFLTASAKIDYSWRKPNRRFIGDNIYLPSLDSKSMGPIVFAVDTSGSMSDDALRECWTEIRAAAEMLNPESVTVVQVDAEVQSFEVYDGSELPDVIEARGRGGTYFDPAFEAVEEEMMQPPACMIYLTDLMGTVTVPEPEYPVLWAAVESPTHYRENEYDWPCEWGERIWISEYGQNAG